MYPQTGVPLSEETPFVPNGAKGKVRALLATMLLSEMNTGKINAVICRAPEFYGPGKTESITNRLIFDNIKKNKTPTVLLRDDKLRTLIWTPDASKAMALIANTTDCYNQTWHLPCDDNRLTYKKLMKLVSEIYSESFDYKNTIRTCLDAGKSL
jgi:nucleoside-diphosphate-sugar epimerase